MQTLHCPQCGYLIAQLAEPKPATPDVAVADWYAQNPWTGERSAADLYADFIATTKAGMSKKAFGMALERCGAVSHRKKNGRYWRR